MPRDARFWRNVTIIALLHVVLLLTFIRWSRGPRKSITSNIVWMNAGAGDAGDATTQNPPPAASARIKEEPPLPAPTPETERKTADKEEAEEEEPILTAAKSEIQLPTATPTPTATAKPTATPKPSPKAAPKATPKPTPKATPKPKAKATPKKLLAKASPKPSATPKEKEVEEESDETAKKKEVAKAALAKKDTGEESGESSEKPVKKAVGAHNGKKSGLGGGGGESSGAGGASEFGWYGNMLHDRFYSEWMQPTTSVPSGAKISALVKIRIEKDGTISDFKIVKPSGIVVVDESVEAVAKRVTQVDPLPAGLGGGGHYDVNINFEVNPSE
jgi:colicin import membrane protein